MCLDQCGNLLLCASIRRQQHSSVGQVGIAGLAALNWANGGSAQRVPQLGRETAAARILRRNIAAAGCPEWVPDWINDAKAQVVCNERLDE